MKIHLERLNRRQRQGAISDEVSFSNLPGMLSGLGALAGSMLFKTFATSDENKISSLKWSANIAVVSWENSIVLLFAVKTD